jgi:glutamate 5-kinase
LRAARDGGVGTRFKAQQGRASSFKLWLKYAKEATGSVVVDRGATEQLRNGGASLLAVGVVDSIGSFEPGDAVSVVSSDEHEVVGKGIVNYSAAELKRVIGLKTEQVRELLPHAADEVIHRDRFVLL